MDLTFGAPIWLLVVTGLVAAAITWWLYRDTIPALPVGQRLFLASLRFLGLFLILFLLCEPIFQRSAQRTLEPVVGLLVDQSESMLLADSLLEGETPGIRDLVASARNEMDDMSLRTFGFGASTEEVLDVDSLSFSHARTDLAGALARLRDELSGDPLAAVVVVSDGLYNTGANPLHEADRYPVPIFSIAHGDTSARRDVRIEGIITNNLTYAGTEVPVQVRVRNEGVPQAPLQVTLLEGGAVRSSFSATLPPSGAELTADLSFEATEPGRRDFQVVITSYEDEVTLRNNEARFDVQVLDQKKAILLLAGAPSPDVAAFARLVEGDDTATLTLRTQKRDGSWHEGELPSDLDAFDLILSVGYPGASSSPTELRRIADLVTSGTPLLYVHDRVSAGSLVQQFFGSVLPLQLASERSTFIDGTIQPTAAAASHAVFDIDRRRDDSRWRRLPPLSLSEARWEAAAGATVLATSEIRGVALPDPVLAIMRRGSVKSAAFTAHGLWRWTLVPEDLQTDAVRFTQLFNNLIQWLYAADDDRLVRVSPVESSFAEGDAILFRGEVYDEALRPLSDASLSLRLTSPGGQVFPYEMQPRGNGRYALDIGSLPAGAYRFEATAMRDGAEVGSDQGDFSIGRRTLEYRQTRADFNLLRQLASRSGGVMVTASDLDGLGDFIRNTPSFEPVTESSLTQIRLWQRLPFLVSILILLSLEWFFRKRWGMV